MADDLVAYLVALLIHSRDRISRQALVFGHGYRVVQLGIESIADLAERLDLELFKTRLSTSTHARHARRANLPRTGNRPRRKIPPRVNHLLINPPSCGKIHLVTKDSDGSA